MSVVGWAVGGADFSAGGGDHRISLLRRSKEADCKC